jgi:phenylacetate-CoA ligase
MRYAFGDVYQVSLKGCPHCGHPWPRFNFFGRLDDLLIVKGVNLYPAGVRDVVMSFAPKVTGEMRIILDTPPPRVVPPLRMKVEYGRGISESDAGALGDEIAQAIGAKLRVTPKIEMVRPGSLPKDPAKKLQLVEKCYQEK